MSAGSVFDTVVGRLCYLRQDADEGELSIPLDRNGFLDPWAQKATAPDELVAGALADPAVVFDAGALVLLGEPGVGKSTTFKQLVDPHGADVVWVDAADLTDTTSFEDRIGGHLRQLPDAHMDPDPAGPSLTVVLDQIDDSPMIRRLESALRRSLEGRDTSRLRLLLACRTADYPRSITDAFEHSGLDCYLADLAPLSRAQAEALADGVFGVDGPELIAAAVEAGAGPLASVPLTLGMLVRTYVNTGALEANPQRLFGDGVVQLADEPDDDRADFATTNGQRVAVAARAAARLLLTAGRTIWQGSQLGAGQLDLQAESLVGGHEGLPDGVGVDVTKDLVQETLGTALFTGRGEHRLAFRHGSISAYLAASHLIARDVPRRQLEPLFLVSGIEGSRTIPALLRETAAWLVTLEPRHAEWLVKADPESLVAHSRIVDSDRTRALIVEALLQRAAEVELSDVPWARSPRRLAHPGLVDQLRSVLEAVDSGEPADWPAKARVRLAVRLAREAAVPGLADVLLDVVESDDWSAHMRQLAALTAAETERAESVPRLRGVLERFADADYAVEVDPSDELRGTLLMVLWPDDLEVEEVLPHLRPRVDRDLIGLYLQFEHTFPEDLAEEDLSEVLRWACEHDDASGAPTPSGASDDPHVQEATDGQPSRGLDEELLEALVDRALAGPTATDRVADVAALLVPRLKRHEDVPMPVPLDVVDPTGEELQSAADLRRALAREMVSLLAEDEAYRGGGAWTIVNHLWRWRGAWVERDAMVPEGCTRAGRRRLLTSHDFAWAYEEATVAYEAGDQELARQFTQLASTLFDPTHVPSFDLVAGDRDHPVSVELKHWFEPVELESDQAVRLKERHRLMHSDGEDDEPHPEASEFAVGQRERLRRAVAGDAHDFWLLLWNLQFPPSTLQGARRLDDDVRDFPGLEVFSDEGAVGELTDAALNYVNNEHDRRHEWLGTTWYDKRGWAGYLALALLERQGRLTEVPDDAWRAWLGALIWFSAVPVNAGDRELKVRLLERAASIAPDELAEAAATYLRGELACGRRASEITLIDPRWAPSLRSVWRQLLGELTEELSAATSASEASDTDAPPSRVLLADEEVRSHALDIWEEMLEVLLESDGAAQDIAVDAVEAGTAESTSWSLAIRAALVLLRHDADRWWSHIHEQAKQDQALAREFAMAVATSRSDHPMLRGLAPDALAGVYRWLADLFPPEDDPDHRGVHFVSREERAMEWRDSILHQLSEQASESDLAVLELSRLTSESPERLIIKSNLIRARSLAREAAWQAPHPHDLARMLADPRRRMVRSSGELAEVVVEVLEEIGQSIEGHGDLLWDRVPQRWTGGESAAWFPKPEAALSAYVTNELRHRLRGRPLIVNREVLVQPTDEYGAGDRTDILVEAPVTHGSSIGPIHDRAAVVIEVKGAWNPDLGTAQRTQLANRYLPEADTDHGVYLVGWFPIELWNEEDRDRRGRAKRHDVDDLDAQLQEQAHGIREELEVATTPVILSVPRARRESDGQPDTDDVQE